MKQNKRNTNTLFHTSRERTYLFVFPLVHMYRFQYIIQTLLS